MWWYKLIVAAIRNGGHGDQYGFYAGRVSLSESWADFLGMTYAHRQYPSNSYHTYGTWLDKLEHTWNEKTNHIPIGLLHDLIDGRGLEQPSRNLDFSGWATINDQVEGFTIQQLYQALQPQILNMQNYKQELENSSLPSTSNTQAQFDDLFSQYGI